MPGHRRANHPGAGEILRPVQPGRGVPGGRPPVRAPVRGRRVVPHRRPGMPRAAYPGHTPACMTYLVGDSAFVGDTLFMPDYGTARCDFPGGDARQLYRSIQRLFALPDATRLFMCHDYTAPGRDEHRCETSVGEQRRHNVHVREGVDEEAFVAMRQQRDATLGMPSLMLPAIQVNMRGGNLPPVEGNGVRYLKIPLDLF
ncbi:MBL fold metallo-hydrolase [Pseudomonas aeruginosa]|nr:MBL fold metallo-hydrolase [Pseudomonas aeruginosa]